MGVLKLFLTLFIFAALKLGRFWSNFFYERWEIMNSESFWFAVLAFINVVIFSY